MKLVVLGAGSWGIALSVLAHRANTSEVHLWGRDPAKIEVLSQTRHSPFFPGLELPALHFSSDLATALKGADIVVCALPCASLPAQTREVVPLLSPDAVVVCGSKGLHPQSGLRPSQIWAGAGLPPANFVALSGPNLAGEIVAGAATSSVVASQSSDNAKKSQLAFDSNFFRVYTNADILGVELGGALKNVVAIAAGLGDGKGFGDNAKAALMTRHWREMARLAVALGARESTLWGLSGLGDLLATCSSAKSRNHRLGTLLGAGRTLDAALHEIAQTVEGIHTCRAALELGEKHGVFLPVTRGLGAILFQGLPVEVALSHLMNRPGRSESEDDIPKMGQ